MVLGKRNFFRLTQGTLRPLWFNLFLALVLGSGLYSCAGLARDMGMDHPTDLQMRAGVTGTESEPTPLDPFKTYDLVMAGDECRFFTMVVPSKWYWKVYLTVANRDDARRGKVTAIIQQTTPPWGVLPNIGLSKEFDLEREGLQAVLGVGNSGEDRTALFRLCQEGAPVHITIASQISATRALMGPGDIQTPGPLGE
jgi:hypothetical protein